MLDNIGLKKGGIGWWVGGGVQREGGGAEGGEEGGECVHLCERTHEYICIYIYVRVYNSVSATCKLASLTCTQR